jgi:methylmalonyl-CoA mutase N-terminal domain/subunit
MKKVDDMGGIVKAVSTGYIQSEVARQAYAREKAIQEGNIVKVGVNKYTIEEEERNIEFHEYDPKQTVEQVARLDRVRKERDDAEVKRTLDVLRDKAKGTENLMPYIIDAVKAYASVGEISGVFREVFGEFKEPVSL